jgi:hypothetical protein
MSTRTRTAKSNSDVEPDDEPDVVPEVLPTPDIRSLEIPELDVRQATLRIVGIAPLIVHRWSEKALKQLEDSQTGKARQQKAPRQPDEERKAAERVRAAAEADRQAVADFDAEYGSGSAAPAEQAPGDTPLQRAREAEARERLDRLDADTNPDQGRLA